MPDVREQVLTPEDRERLSLLCTEANENIGLLTGYRDQASVEMRWRLRDEGEKAAVYILDLLNNREAVSDYESYKYIQLLDLCASERDAERIGGLLVRDDVALALDRSIKSKILKILERIGTPENADHLASFCSKCFDAQNRSNFQRDDSIAAIQSLYGIGFRLDVSERDTDGSLHERVDGALENMRNTIRDRTGQAIDSDEEYTFGQNAFLEDAQANFADLFEVREELRESNNRSDAYDPYDYGDNERDMSWENEQDNEMEDSYRENKFAEVESRLETVKRLRYEVKKEKEIKENPEDEEGKFLRRHRLEYREDRPSPYTPTLGIEIEIREQSVLLSEATQWSEGDRERFLEKKKHPYRKTEKLGVPAGKDKFWEFANAPTHYYATLSREVQALIEMGLINPDYPRHPLHITIGGISLGVSMNELYAEDGMSLEQAADELMPESGKETFVLARSLEATGWSTTGGRLLRPYLAKGQHSAWTVKGVGGVKERPRHQIELGVKEAVEFRTFQMQNFAGLDRTLRSAFLLGAALRAYQTDAGGVPLEAGEDSVIRKQLSEIWKNFSHESRRIFSACDLADPQDAWQTPSYTDNDATRAKNSFKHFGDVIDEARQHPKSRGAEFVAEMRGLIITTRKQVADIIYKEIPSASQEAVALFGNHIHKIISFTMEMRTDILSKANRRRANILAISNLNIRT